MTSTSNALLVLGRGELYFDRFPDGSLIGEGEQYLGNTPGFTVTRSAEEVDRYTSYGGQKIKLTPVILSETHGASITTDNISVENMATWFAGPVDYTGQVAIGMSDEEITVKRGRWYQLGLSEDPFGLRYVEPDLVFSIGSTTIEKSANFILDLEEGRFFVLADAPDISDGNTLNVSFQWRQTSSTTLTNAPTPVIGSLRYVARNEVSLGFSYFFPKVQLSPNSEINLKGDQWQQIQFSVDILKLNPSASIVYAKGLAVPGLTADEQAIIDHGGMTLEEFPYWEDQLNQIINVSMPAAHYGQVITYP